MNVLIFTVADLHYALPSRHTVEVVPVVNTRPLPHAPQFVRGLMDYRGQLVPVLQTAALLGAPTRETRMANRIIVLRHPSGETTTPQLALIVDHVIGLGICEFPTDAAASPTGVGEKMLGPVVRRDEGTLQFLNIAAMFEKLAASEREVSSSSS